MARFKQTARKSTSAARTTPATSMPPASSVSPATSVIPAKRKFYKDSVVTIFVDKSKRPFYLHLDLLCDASPFFKAAFAGNFKEASEKTMQLPDVRENTFELFADWLYYQRYEMLPREDDDDKDNQEADAEGGVKEQGGNEDEKKSEDDDDEEDDDEDDYNDHDKVEKRFMHAFRLFVFADKYNVCKLKSNIIKALLEDFQHVHGNSVPTTAITYAYKHTAQGSGLRRLLADFPLRVIPECFENPEIQAYLQKQSDFAVDVIISFAKHNQRTQTRTRNPLKNTTPEEYEDKSPGQENGHSNAK
ncbi:hypothetical protein BDR22DRAFT_822699 [Usnea florida]